MNAFGTAVKSPLSISWNEPEGALWFNRAVLIHPRFEINLKVTINANGCNEADAWALDGFTAILSKTNNYLNGGGGSIGYQNIYDALVTEFDFMYNQNLGDAGWNTISLHRCYKTNCTPNEGSNTTQRDISFQAYDKCRIMNYDIYIIYNNGNFRVYLGDTLVIESNENLSERFDNAAYLGFTGFFRGRRRDLIIAGSSICEDDFVPAKFNYRFLIGGIPQAPNTSPEKVPAGSLVQFTLGFVDAANLPVPHTFGLNIWTWSILVGSSCGDNTALVFYDKLNLIMNVTGCTKQGKENIEVQLNGQPSVFFYFSIVGKGFSLLEFAGYEGKAATEATSTTVNSSINIMFFNWGSLKGDFSADDFATTNGLTFQLRSVDEYGNTALLGTDTAAVSQIIGGNVYNSNIGNVVFTIKVIQDGLYSIFIPVTSKDAYAMSFNKLPKAPASRYSFWVIAGKPTTNKSICSLDKFTSTPTLDVGKSVQINCKVYDYRGSFIDAYSSTDAYGTKFGAKLDRTDSDGKVTSETFESNAYPGADFTFGVQYNTKLHGRYSFVPYFSLNGGGIKTAINTSLFQFYVNPTPSDITKIQVMNWQTGAVLSLDSNKQAAVNYVGQTVILACIDFLDGDGTPLSKIGYGSWDPKTLKGSITNVHDLTYSTTDLVFNYITINSRQWVGINMASGKAGWIKKSMHQYQVKVTLGANTITLTFFYGNNPGYGFDKPGPCIHAYDPTRTVFTLFSPNTKSLSIPPNQSTEVGQIRLSTTDGFLYNFKLADKSEISIIVSPPVSERTKVSVDEMSVDGFYSAKFSSTRAGDYVITINHGTLNLLKDFKITVRTVEVINSLETTLLNTFTSEGTDIDKTISEVFTTDATPEIYFKGLDIYYNYINVNPDLNNSYLRMSFTLSVSSKQINPVIGKDITFTYNSQSNVFVIKDMLKIPGKYVLTVISIVSSKSLTFRYTKNPGKMSPSLSSGSLATNKNLKVGQSATVTVALKDNSDQFLAIVDSLGQDAGKNLQVKATALDSTEIAFKFIDISQFQMRFSSDNILKQSTYTPSVIYVDPATKASTVIACSDCLFYVNYDKFDITMCKLRAILSKTLEMSEKSILQVKNQEENPLFTFDFYDSNNIQLQYVDKTSILKATFSGNMLDYTFNMEWIGTNQIMWTFPKEVILKDIKGANYSLKIFYNNVVSQTYTLQFLGDGQDSDAGNGGPQLDNTFFSTTDIRPTAGVNEVFNIQFRTVQNLRVNQYGDLKLFSFTNSKQLTDKYFIINVQFGAKKGDYIFTVNSTVASSSVDPIILTISYNGVTLKQQVKVIVKSGDLSNITVQKENIKDTAQFLLKDGSSINSYSISLQAFDKYLNMFEDLFDSSIFSSDRIVRLFNIQHSSNAQITSSVSLNVLVKNFNLVITSRTIGIVSVSSSFMTNSWKFEVLPGPISTKYTFGVFLTTNTNFVAGDTCAFSVFPRDDYNNIIKSSLLAGVDLTSIDMSVKQPKGVAVISKPIKSTNANDNSVVFQQALVEAGDNNFIATVGGIVVTCLSCTMKVNLTPVVFAKSKLYLGNDLVQTALQYDLNKATLPTFSLNLYDKYDNLYNFIPSDFTLTATFSGNESNIKLCTEISNNAVNIFVCKDNVNRKNWQFLISKDGYSITLKYKEESLLYKINLVGGAADADASNGPIDVSKTYFSQVQVTNTAGSSAYFMIELRTADGKRKNYWYDAPNDDIKVSFSKVLDNAYTTDVSMGDKPGQYIIKVSSTKTFGIADNNKISLTIEKIPCTTNSVSFLVTPNIPVSANLINSNGVEITRGTLPVGNADIPYRLNIRLYDKYKNFADVDTSLFTYKIGPPVGKEDRQITSNIIKNSDLSFTLTILSIYSGDYSINSGYLGDPYVYSVGPGAPSAANSLAKAPTKATAGDVAKIYLIPYDTYNNYIDPKNLSGASTNNGFSVAYKYKDKKGENYLAYVSITSFVIDKYPDDDVGCKNCNAYVYSVQLSVRYQNYFRISLGTTNEIKCVNCVTDVASAALMFSKSSFQRYDSVTGHFIELEENCNEDNAKTDVIYRIYPRDQFMNKIDFIQNVKNYSIKLNDKDGKSYVLLNQTPEGNNQQYVEFVKNDNITGVNKDLNYNSLVGGAYKALISDTSEIITKSIVLIGRPDDAVASNQEIEEQNTVINESKRTFTAGQSGYVMIELRTINNLRKNNWNQKVEVRHQILDKNGKPVGISDTSFTSNVRPAGVLGVFYATMSSSLATTSLTDGRTLVLQIVVNDKIVTKLKPELTVNPAPMSKAAILTSYLQQNSQTNLLDGDADTIRMFKVSAFDSFGNPTACDPLVLKLSALGPDNTGVAITAGREVTTGYATYVVDNKVAGSYSIGSSTGFLPTFYFNNKCGNISIDNSIIVVADKLGSAGISANLFITAKDKYKNIIPASDVQSKFSAETYALSGSKVSATKTVSNNNIQFSSVLTQKGVNTWKVYLDSTPVACDNCATLISPDVASPGNSVVFCENAGGVLSEYPNLSELKRSNINPLVMTLKLKDKYKNLIDIIPDDVSIVSPIMSGKNMDQITFEVKKAAENNQFLISVPQDKFRSFNHLVSGLYVFKFNVDRKSDTSFQFVYNVNLTSDTSDSGYGNGKYSVEQTELSNTQINLYADNTFTLNMRLKTADRLYYYDDIDIDNDVTYSISMTDNSFKFKIYKKSRNFGDYNIDVYSSISQPDSQMKLTIKLRDPLTNSFKSLSNDVLISIKPSVPPSASNTEIVSKPAAIITPGTAITVAFKLYDKFGNIYLKNSDIANSNNLIITHNNEIIKNDAIAIQLKQDGVTYEVSYKPNYPPRNCEINIFYKDSKQQVSILTDTIKTSIVSEPFYPNTIVTTSKSFNELNAGMPLDLSVVFYDRNNICLDNIEKIPVIATVIGPMENEESKRINYTYKFKLTTATDNNACSKSYKVDVPKDQIYNIIGVYKIVVKVGENAYEAKSFDQKIVSDDLDPTKFISRYTMTGEFNPGRVTAGTEIKFTIQGNDKFLNQVKSSFIKNISIKLVDRKGKIAISNIDNKTNFDYSILFTEVNTGIVNTSLIIKTSADYTIQYFYNGVALNTIDSSRGPFDLKIVPQPCSVQNPVVVDDLMKKASTGKPTSFDIKCMDLFNNTISTGGENFKIFLTVNVEESKTSTEVKTKLKDNNDGTYTVEFVPPLAGKYILVIDLRGDLYGQNRNYEIKDSVCPTVTPNRCPNNTEKCVVDLVECIENRLDCRPDAPFNCKVNGVNKCVASQTSCDCPTDYIKCYPNICVPKVKDYMCSFSLPVACSSQFPASPVLCPDGICRSKLQDQPSQRVCPIGFVLCPDLTCRKGYSDCLTYDDCPNKNMIRCPDQSCVLNQKDCPSLITCPKAAMLVCPDGSCVTSEIFCKPLPQCIAPNNILCADNSCVSDIKNCPKQVACGHTLSLCTDIICRQSCLK